MSFLEEMVSVVKAHGAINNDFLSRFARGCISGKEFERFAVEFYHFSRHFPLVLCHLLINTSDEDEAANLTKILVSELGDGDSKKRHELLYRDFLRSLNIEPRDIICKPMLNTTRNWIETQLGLYSGKDHFAGLGASFGLENMAIPMWDQLIPGLKKYKEKWFHNMDLTYFTFHRELEDQHEDMMRNTLSIYEGNVLIQESFKNGIKRVLDDEEKFWLGLKC